jgi:hypothetical protein
VREREQERETETDSELIGLVCGQEKGGLICCIYRSGHSLWRKKKKKNQKTREKKEMYVSA